MTKKKRATSVKANFLYNVAYQVLVLILPLVTAPYLSRVLGSGQLGEYSYTYAIANYFVMFARLGVNSYGNRCVARVRDDQDALTRTFWSVYAFQAFMSVVMMALYLAYAFAVSGDVLLSLVWLPLVFSAAFDVTWFFFGLEEFKTTVGRNFAVKLSVFVLTLTFVRGEYALFIYCALMASSFLASAVVLWPFLRGRVGLYRPGVLEVLAHCKPNLVLFIPVIAVSLYTSMDKVLLGSMSTMEQAGLFESAQKVATLPTTFITALGTVMLPRTVNLLASGRREEARSHLGQSMWFGMMLALAFGFGIAAVAPTLSVAYFGSGFEGTAPLMFVMALDIPFIAWANVLRSQYLIPEGRDGAFVSSVVAGAVVNVAICVVAVPSVGALGAAFGTFAAEATVCLVQSWVVNEVLPLGRWFRENVAFLFIGLLMFVAVRAVAGVFGTGVVSLVIQLGVGCIVYAGLCLAWFLVTKNTYYHELVVPMLHAAIGEVRRKRGRQ